MSFSSSLSVSEDNYKYEAHRASSSSSNVSPPQTTDTLTLPSPLKPEEWAPGGGRHSGGNFLCLKIGYRLSPTHRKNSKQSRCYPEVGFSSFRSIHLEWGAIAFSRAAATKSLQSCPTLRPHGQQPTRLLCPQDSPGKNPGVGCHFLLQKTS